MWFIYTSQKWLKYRNDSTSFSEAINGDNYDKWLDSMNDELKSITQNDVWDFQKDAANLGVNGSLRLNVILMTILNVTRPDLLLKVLLKWWHWLQGNIFVCF